MDSTRPLRIDPIVLCQVLVLTAMLCWPLLLLGHPTYYLPDSISYYADGRQIVGTAAERLDIVSGPLPAPKAARSILYSATAYVASGPAATMVYLVVLQAGATALICVLIWRAFGPGVMDRRFGVFCVLLATVTPCAWVATLAMPDIFSGLMLGATLIIMHGAGAVAGATKWLLIAITAYAATAHASNLPLLAGLIGVVLLVGVVRKRRFWPLPSEAGSLLVALAGAVAITVAAGAAIFGNPSLMPGRYPLALGRSIDDGPGRWYLARHCRQHNYAVCPLLQRQPPGDLNALMWGPDGIVTRATPAQMDAIRAEESRIVLGAATAYPQAQLLDAAANLGRQLWHFGLDDLSSDVRLKLDADGTLTARQAGLNRRGLTSVLDALSICAVIAALAWIVLAWRQRTPRERMALLVVLAGLFGNALICGVFSAVADRYQARVIWVLPVIVSAMAFRHLAPAMPEKGGAAT